MKKNHYWTIGVLLILIITNPSVKAFKDHLGITSYVGLKRRYNLFVFSIYDKGDNSYLGIIGNFFLLKHWVNRSVPVQTRPDSFLVDSGSTSIDTIRH